MWGVVTVSHAHYLAVGVGRALSLLAGVWWFAGVALRGLWFGELPWQAQRAALHHQVVGRVITALLVLLVVMVLAALCVPAY